MNDFLNVLITQPFMQHALLGGLLACIACGIIGPFVVARKISVIAGGLSHTVLAGLGIAYFLNKSPLAGALIAAVTAAWIIGWVTIRMKRYEEIIISILWAAGMAVGILFITLTPGYNADLMSYLFGNILLISKDSMYLLMTFDSIILILITLFYKQLLATAFDEEFTETRGINVQFYYLLLLTLIALTVVCLIQVVGLILVLALLTIPAAIAGQYVKFLKSIMISSILLGWLFVIIGLFLSYITNLPSGAIIILAAAAGFIISVGIKKLC